ncbi:hypothetical protein LOAG_11587 [Loa loa]|uniref:Remorin_C domain-containing protein n=1 Tax=Loa loa TaxID=7209 RepID=A0A1I7VEX0_LOALO|nr:hypothetical protein LOAG_11587 [Loa loa]EFO16915.1 hypothetical protein LOAG_11587 [Loa loa]
MSSIVGSEKHNSESGSSTVLSEFDAEYACSDHAMVRQVVQTAVRNYFSASCTSPAHMTLCIDFTEGAPIPSNSTAVVQYQAPLVQINVERKFDPRSTNVASTARKDGESLILSTSEKVSRGKAGTRTESPVFNAAKKLSVFTIKEEEDEDLKPVKAVIEVLKSKISLQRVDNLKCAEKKTAKEKVFKYLSVTYKKFMSQEMFMEWKKKYEEDKRALYSDQQGAMKDSLSTPVTVYSDTSVTLRETGTITKDERMNVWGAAAGILDFEPKDSRGNLIKAVQIRGCLPNTL